MNQDRRNFLKGSLLSPFLLPQIARGNHIEPMETEPHFLLFYQMVGAWDVCLAFDPKDRDQRSPLGKKMTDQPYSINEVVQHGIHPLPPVGQVLKDFSHQMMIVNGIDMEVDSGHHMDNVMSGVQMPRSKNAPYVQAMLSKLHPYASGCPIPHLFASYRNNFFAGPLVSRSVQSSPEDMAGILMGKNESEDTQQENELLTLMHQEFSEELGEISRRTFKAYPDAGKAVLNLQQKWSESGGSEKINPNFQDPENLGVFLGYLFKSGICGIITLQSTYGFDTHSNHYEQHPLESALKDIRTYFQSLSKVPLSQNSDLSIADRTTIILISEYARTPFINNVNGKDHNSRTNSLVTLGYKVHPGRFGASGFHPISKSTHAGLPIDYATGLPLANGKTLKMASVWAGMENILGANLAPEFGREVTPVQFIK